MNTSMSIFSIISRYVNMIVLDRQASLKWTFFFQTREKSSSYFGKKGPIRCIDVLYNLFSLSLSLSLSLLSLSIYLSRFLPSLSHSLSLSRSLSLSLSISLSHSPPFSLYLFLAPSVSLSLYIYIKFLARSALHAHI